MHSFPRNFFNPSKNSRKALALVSGLFPGADPQTSEASRSSREATNCDGGRAITKALKSLKHQAGGGGRAGDLIFAPPYNG